MIPKKFFKHFEKPVGIPGKIAGYIMSVNNKKRSDWTIEKLKFKPSDYLLEIGYGPGVTFKRIADGLTTGFIAGIDHSEVMQRAAIKRNKENIRNNKADLRCGLIDDLGYPEKYFDIVYGSNVHFFWKDPVAEFKKLYSLLRENGKLVFVFQPRYLKSDNDLKAESLKTKAQFLEAGYRNIEIDFKNMKPVGCIYISGQK